MPPAHQVVDSLWHCLCPSFASFGPARTTTSFLRLQPRVTIRNPQSAALRFRSRHRRLHSTATTAAAAAETTQAPVAAAAISTRVLRTQTNNEQTPASSSNGTDSESLSLQRERLDKLRKLSPDRLLQDLPVQAAKGDWVGTWEMMSVLVQEHGLRPTAKEYALLIEANCSLYEGSVREVQGLLMEMEAQGIQPDQQVYEAMLKFLAIHPSYTLRSAVLQAMGAEWVEVRSTAEQHVVCGLLRERQIELALEQLEDMNRRGVSRPAWLIDTFIHTLADIGEFDAMFPLLQERAAAKSNHPSQLLYANVLSKAAAGLHYPTVKFVWDTQAALGLINPSSGLCTSILDTAARVGDHQLATDVFRILGNRSSPLKPYQYEALLESRLNGPNPDLYTAFSVVCIMHQSNPSSVTDHTTRPVYLFLRDQGEFELERAWKMAILLHKHGSQIPIELINAILDAAVHQRQLDWALERYGQLHRFSASGTLTSATTFTFNTLLRGCYKAGRKDKAMFVAAEMVALKVSPDALTYDRLILACLHGGFGEPTSNNASPSSSSSNDPPNTRPKDASTVPDISQDQTPSQLAFALSDPSDARMPSEIRQEQQRRNLDDAFRYLEEMQSRGWTPRAGTLSVLGRMAVELGDGRSKSLLDWMLELGMDVEGIRAVQEEVARARGKGGRRAEVDVLDVGKGW